jgi:2-oxoglutarate ferredoxin oxidoreductase subunit delta
MSKATTSEFIMFREATTMTYWRKPFDADKIEIPQGVVHILENQCKGCGFCVEYCPKDVLKLSEGYNLKGYHTPMVVKENDCIHCQLCELICPEFAIFVTLKNNQPLPVITADLRKEAAVDES